MILNASNFTGKYSHLNNKKLTLNISRLGLARCVMTAGCNGRRAILNRGILRHCYLGAMVLSNTTNTPKGLALDDAFHALDMSEKIPISYHLGMGLTKAFSEQHLNIPWLSHISAFKNSIRWNGKPIAPKLILYKTKKHAREPDLIGYDSNGRPHVLESKGYSSGFSGSELQHAINQVSQVNTIAGVTPETRTACFHDLSGYAFKSRIVDPEGPDLHGLTVEWDLHSALESYYSIFNSLEGQLVQRQFRKHKYFVIPIIKPDIYFGIDADVLEMLKDKKKLNAELFIQIFERSKSFQNSIDGSSKYDLGLDGIIIFND